MVSALQCTKVYSTCSLNPIEDEAHDYNMTLRSFIVGSNMKITWITDGETRDDIAEKLGMAEWPCLLAAQRCDVWFRPGCCRSCLAAAWWLCGAAWHQGGNFTHLHRVESATTFLIVAYCGYSTDFQRKLTSNMPPCFRVQIMILFSEILLLRLSHFRDLECFECDELRFKDTLGVSPAFWGWCRHRMGWTAWMPAKGWRLGCRAWQKLTPWNFCHKKKFTEFHWVDEKTSPHQLQLEVVPNPDKNGEFFEAHLHWWFFISTRSPFDCQIDGRTLRAHLQRQNLVKLACFNLLQEIWIFQVPRGWRTQPPRGGLYGCMT